MKKKSITQNEDAFKTDEVLTEKDLQASDSESQIENKKQDEQINAEQTELQKILEEKDAQICELAKKQDEYLGLARQIQADFDNYRKRTQDLSESSRKDGISFAVEKLLPVLDTINSAKRQIKDEEFLKSIDLIYRQTLDCFSRIGVQKIEAVGKPFDPNLHNAVFTEHIDGTEPDIVLDELQEGFELGGKVIRHSVVKVSQ